MAVINYSGLIDSIKGKMQGTVFQKGSTRHIIRNKGSVHKTNSFEQQQKHQILQAKHKAWQNLSASDKQSWRDYAALYDLTDKFGVSRTISGHNWFCSANCNLDIIGQSNLTTAPSHDVPADVPTYTATVGTSELKIYFPNATDFSTDQLVIMATPKINNGTMNFFGKLRILSTNDSVSASASNILLDTLYEQLFGYTIPFPENSGAFSVGFALFRINKNSGVAGPYFSTIEEL